MISRDRTVNSLLIADITSLQWRSFVNGAVNLPYVPNAFIAGYIVSGINGYSLNGWRWGVSTVCSATAIVRRLTPFGFSSLACFASSYRSASRLRSSSSTSVIIEQRNSAQSPSQLRQRNVGNNWA